MKREHTSLISTILDRWIPPILREQRWFYKIILKRAVGGDVDAYLDFRDNVWKMSPEDTQTFYKSVFSNIDRPTDCNAKSIQRIMTALTGKDIFEFGCGRGYIAQLIIEAGFTYTGVDFDISAAKKNEKLAAGKFVEATDLRAFAIGDDRYDTVLCTHTLEHVLDIRAYVKDLRALTRKRLVIVVPLQLNLRYTPDLHTYFFRRPGDFMIAAGFTADDNLSYFVDDGDLCVILDVK